MHEVNLNLSALTALISKPYARNQSRLCRNLNQKVVNKVCSAKSLPKSVVSTTGDRPLSFMSRHLFHSISKSNVKSEDYKTAAPVKAIVDEVVSIAKEKLAETPVAKKFRKAKRMSEDEEKEEQPTKKPRGKAGRKASQVEEVESSEAKEEVKPTESTETEEVKPGKVRRAKETPREVSKRKKKVRFEKEEEEPQEEEVKEEPEERKEEEVKQREVEEEEEQREEEEEQQREEEEAKQAKEEEEAEEEEEEEKIVKKEVPKEAAKEERVVVDRKKPPNASKATEKEKSTTDALEDMIEQIHQQHEIQHKKEYCNYRKSCYSSEKKPKIDSSVVGIISSFGEQLEKAYAEEEDAISRTRNELDKKVACKYRKSCYETGILPEIKKPIIVEDDSIPFKVGLSKHLQCKYRKSCYVKNGLKPIHHEAEEVEEKRKPEKRKTQKSKKSRKQ